MGPDGTGRNSEKRTNGRIFVVDDEPMLLELVSAILSPEGYEVAGFRNGESALRAYVTAPQKPVLIITDFAMGIGLMTGLDLVSACREVEPGQKVLLLSGTVDESVFGETTEKPDAFLAKPYQPRELKVLVRSLTSKD